MADKCFKCGNIAEDNCAGCKKPVCRRHSKKVGEYVVCQDCADKFR